MTRPPSALWLFRKPVGVTSFSLVEAFRREHAGPWPLKVSHGGVLDPFAHGLVVLLVGAANRLFPLLHEVPKTYRATVRWGAETDTGDAGGRVVQAGEAGGLEPALLDAALARFRGWTEQVPPATSNKRVEGERAYMRAHRGEAVTLAPQRVYLHAARWLAHRLPEESELELSVRGGFYVRSLAVDLGRALGCGAHLSALERTALGPWACPAEGAPVALTGRELLPWLPAMTLTDEAWGRVKREEAVLLPTTPPPAPLPEGFPPPTPWVRAFHRERLVALVQPGPVLLLPGGV